MVKSVHQALVADIKTAIARLDMSKAEFGILAVNDPRLVYDLDKGRELRSATEAKVKEALNALKAQASKAGAA